MTCSFPGCGFQTPQGYGMDINQMLTCLDIHTKANHSSNERQKDTSSHKTTASKFFIIIISNSDYTKSQWDNLPGVKQDLEAIRNYFYESFDVEIIENSTNIGESIE